MTLHNRSRSEPPSDSDDLLSEIRGQSPAEFEQWVAELLRLHTPEAAVQLVGGSGDRGVDVIVRDKDGMLVVQCKRYAPHKLVGSRDMQLLLGAMMHRHTQRGAFVTTSRFTAEARAIGQEHRIWLVDTDELLILAAKYDPVIREKKRAAEERQRRTREEREEQRRQEQQLEEEYRQASRARKQAEIDAQQNEIHRVQSVLDDCSRSARAFWYGLFALAIAVSSFAALGLSLGWFRLDSAAWIVGVPVLAHLILGGPVLLPCSESRDWLGVARRRLNRLQEEQARELARDEYFQKRWTDS